MNEKPARLPIATRLNGDRLIRHDLEKLRDEVASKTVRWVIARKADVVSGVRHGLITLEEATSWFLISEEEFLHWKKTLEKHGSKGLRVTKCQDISGSTLAENADKKAGPNDRKKNLALAVVKGEISFDEALQKAPYLDHSTLQYWVRKVGKELEKSGKIAA